VLDQAAKKVNGQSVDLSFKLNGGAINYRLTVENGTNPFFGGVLSNFRLPSKLLDTEKESKDFVEPTEFYENENNFFNENKPIIETLNTEVSRAIYNSKFRTELEKEFEKHYFKLLECKLVLNEKAIPFMQKENALSTKYDKIISILVKLGGIKMHDGCSGKFDDGMQVLAKLRMMGFSKQDMPFPMTFTCKECGKEITMTTFEYECPHCSMIYAVTPCHAFDVENILSAGKAKK